MNPLWRYLDPVFDLEIHPVNCFDNASIVENFGALKTARKLAKPIVYAYKVNPPSFFVEVAKQAKRARMRRA